MITKNFTNDQVKDVTLLQFGTGNIRFDKVHYADGSVGLAFAQVEEPHEIGSETSENVGKELKELTDVQVLMDFSNPASIAALIHSLIEIQKQMLK